MGLKSFIQTVITSETPVVMADEDMGVDSFAETAALSRPDKSSEKIALQQYNIFARRFEGSEDLQSGATGNVRLATDTTTGRTVVLKQYKPDRQKRLKSMYRLELLNRGNDDRLDMELKYLKQCVGLPGIVQLQAAFQDRDLPSHTTIVLEHARHGDLFDIANKHYNNFQPPEPLVWHWMVQMCAAVNALHEGLGPKSIIHGDIKLENWLVCAPQQWSQLYNTNGMTPSDVLPPWAYPDLKLADFDIARFEHEPEFEGACGTPASQAPEYALTQGRVSNQTKTGDVWSVGACLHFLVTSRYPIRTSRHCKHLSKGNCDSCELHAERKVGKVVELGYSEDLDIAFRGVKTKVGRRWRRHQGLMNMDVEYRWTARQGQNWAEGVIVKSWRGAAQAHRLWEGAYAEDAARVEQKQHDTMVDEVEVLTSSMESLAL